MNVLVIDLRQPLLCNVPSVDVTVGFPHASVAVALPNAVSIAPAFGLHPNCTSSKLLVKLGGVISTVQVTVLTIVAELPQASVAVNVLV